MGGGSCSSHSTRRSSRRCSGRPWPTSPTDPGHGKAPRKLQPFGFRPLGAPVASSRSSMPVFRDLGRFRPATCSHACVCSLPAPFGAFLAVGSAGLPASFGRLPFGPRPRAVGSHPLHCRVRGLPAPGCQLLPHGLPLGSPFGSAVRPLLGGASLTHPSDRHPRALHRPRRTCGGPPAPGPHGPFAGSVPDRSGPATPRIAPVRGVRTIREPEGSETRFWAVLFANRA